MAGGHVPHRHLSKHPCSHAGFPFLLQHLCKVQKFYPDLQIASTLTFASSKMRLRCSK